MVLIKNQRLRRAIGLSFVVAGALFLWLAPEVGVGIVLLVAGVALEIAGITLERRTGATPSSRDGQ